MIDERKKEKRQKNLSLHPLEFDEAISDILKVTPESKQGEDEVAKNNPISADKQNGSHKQTEKRLLKVQTQDTPITKISRKKKS